ncbi:MAG TPA: c-type cytochrome, partial [Terriglobia bacterium]|nr:c-type cytochrome [Terriglobia bacterium]
MSRRLLLSIGASGLIALSSHLVTIAQGNPEAAKIKNPIPSSPDSIAAGKKSWSKCASCHGINGEGG